MFSGFCSYPVPTGRTFRGQLLHAAGVLQEELKDKIRKLPTDSTVALTMDLWSNRQLLSFLGMTLHTGCPTIMYHILKGNNAKVNSNNTAQMPPIESTFRAILFDRSK